MSESWKALLPKSRILSGLYAVWRYLRLPAHREMNACLDDILHHFVPEAAPRECRRLKLSILYHRNYYRIQYQEYFLFHFRNLNHKGKKEFVGESERAEICRHLVSEEHAEKKQIFRNKYQTFLRFGNYYHREVILLASPSDYEKFAAFAAGHETAVLKPYDGYSGKGITMLRFSEIRDLQEYFSKLISRGKYVLEEVIQQAGEMAAFHPESVNTIRLATYYDGSEVVPLFACLRMGAGRSVVDNAGSGGIGAAVDIPTGVVSTAAVSKSGQTCLVHPDTHQKIIGFHVPCWSELLALAETAAKVVPEVPYIAWDFAFTPKGWCMIEANNSGQFGNQYRENKGFRTMTETYFRPVS